MGGVVMIATQVMIETHVMIETLVIEPIINLFDDIFSRKNPLSAYSTH